LRNIGEMDITTYYVNDSPLWDYNTLVELENSYGSSFYLLDVNQLKENYRKINQAFKKRYSNFIIGYSYKTNYLPYICKELSKMGAYAEVVSRLEYDLAIKIGEDPKKIIFNGPLKSFDDIQVALTNGSILNVDSLYEIHYVKEYANSHPNKQVRIGIRINFSLTGDKNESLQGGYEASRFGICVENGSFEKALGELKEFPNIRVVGLHGHFSTKERSLESYRKKTRRLSKIAKENFLDELEFIDVGGGIYGELPKSFNVHAPSFDDYAEEICEVMNDEFRHLEKKPALILEPGVSMVANTLTFVSKVIEIKKITDKNFVLVDGSVHNIKPTMHSNNLPVKIIRRDGSHGRKRVFDIVGYTCMEKDYLAHGIEEELPQIGDYIVFENVGAYTIVFNPPFIKERPGILAIENNVVFPVRKKETIKQFFNEELYYF
jgi:diaminopimelate decarboxylase